MRSKRSYVRIVGFQKSSNSTHTCRYHPRNLKVSPKTEILWRKSITFKVIQRSAYAPLLSFDPLLTLLTFERDFSYLFHHNDNLSIQFRNCFHLGDLNCLFLCRTFFQLELN